jgi:hypothetical protein
VGKKKAAGAGGGKRKRRGPNRSAFIREYLERSPSASAREVADAWTGAKHRGKLSPTLYYQIRRRMGVSGGKGKRRGRPGKAAAAGGYLGIEQQLDQLIALAHGQGDTELSEALRTARRHVSAKILRG